MIKERKRYENNSQANICISEEQIQQEMMVMDLNIKFENDV